MKDNEVLLGTPIAKEDVDAMVDLLRRLSELEGKPYITTDGSAVRVCKQEGAYVVKMIAQW
jgi:hypothetical protein